MSSDSDSDVCDFTSDIAKQISKGRDQFWQNFNKRTEINQTDNSITVKETDLVANTLIEDSPSCTSKRCKVDGEFEVKKESTVTQNTLIEDGPSTFEGKIENNVTQNVDRNIPNRITNKLNELSAEIETILSNKRSVSRKRAKRIPQRQCQQRRSKRNSNCFLPIAITPSATIISDESSPSKNVIIQEELNPIVTINVLWKSVEKNSFKVHKYQVLNCILDHYSEKYNVNPKLLFFTLDDKHIKLEENSFVSLRLSESKQIEGGTLPESYLNKSLEFTNLTCNEPLKLKVQHYSRKNKEINVGCRTDDKMEIIFWKVSRSIQQPVENLKLYFDGNAIKPSMKICEMDIEEGDCLDLEILNLNSNTI